MSLQCLQGDEINDIEYFLSKVSLLWTYQERGAKANEGQALASEEQITCYTEDADQELSGTRIVTEDVLNSFILFFLLCFYFFH